MCGICGIINFNNQSVHESQINMMIQKIKHRGPDDKGIFIDGSVGFGFVRLSILDLSPLGHQPMWDDQKRFMIIHNGEVYNYIELREELKAKGYTFQSNTDTEVILKSYIEWGEDCLPKFNGMWSFVIYDRDVKDLFISRDRYGIKPFYYYLDHEKFIFASEIPPVLEALRATPHAPRPTPDYQAIFDYLVFNRTDQTEMTFFEGIKKLQHGNLIRFTIDDCRFTNNDLKIKRWYDLRESVDRVERFRNLEEYRETFSSAVGLRLRSDVPVGVCLSGGLDSSSIVSVLLKDYNKQDLNTFSAVYGKSRYGDESEFINEYSSLLKNVYFTYPSEETLFSDMKEFIKAQGEPVPSTSPYAQFKVMELAKDHVVVTLDGQGADESLAGYHYFFGFYFKDLLKGLRLHRLFSEIYHYLRQHGSIYGLKTFLYFLLPDAVKTKTRVNEKGYLVKDFVELYSRTNQVSQNIYGSGSLNEALIDHFEYKLEHLLKWEDRNSMWFSLEARVPFLDYRLVEKTLAIHEDWIINQGETKYVLREALNGTLPEKIKNRKDKIGFATPAGEWFNSEKFKCFLVMLVQDGYFFNNVILDKKSSLNLLQKHFSAQIDINRELWKWINLELWFQIFIDN